VPESILAVGPANYFGGSIMTFALPCGLFIVVAAILFIIYKRPHTALSLRYLGSAQVVAVATPETRMPPAAPSGPAGAAPADSQGDDAASGAKGTE
jgi:hypothetical protein